MTDIFLPGMGRVPFNITSARNAVEEYDDKYTLGRNEHTGEWVVLLKHGPHDGEPFPVFNLGLELPSHDEIQRKLYESDVRRHGGKIAEQIQRVVDERQKEARRATDEGSGVAAEAMEWAHRKFGSHPSPRIFVPGKDN